MTIDGFDNKDGKDDDNTSDDEYSVEEEVDNPRDKKLINELTTIRRDELYEQQKT